MQIPKSALIHAGNEMAVFVQDPVRNDVFAQRLVSVRRQDEKMAMIDTSIGDQERVRGVEALLPGERVVVTGAEALDAGLRISKRN